MSGFNLVINFVHKDLRLKVGFQISPVDQVKVSFKSVSICKKKRHTPISSQTVQTMTTPRVNALLLQIPHLVPPPRLDKESRRATLLT